MNHQIKEINDKIMQKCSFVTLESIDETGFCFDLRVDDIIFGPWGIETRPYSHLIEEGEMPMMELRDMGMNEDQEIQLMQEINDAMQICEDFTSLQKTTEKPKIEYYIWTDNGTPTIFESNSHSLNDVLDEFCADAGYIDHADCLQQMEWTTSPFNIKPTQPLF
jgi:hypothetical protein